MFLQPPKAKGDASKALKDWKICARSGDFKRRDPSSTIRQKTPPNEADGPHSFFSINLPGPRLLNSGATSGSHVPKPPPLTVPPRVSASPACVAATSSCLGPDSEARPGEPSRRTSSSWSCRLSWQPTKKSALLRVRHLPRSPISGWEDHLQGGTDALPRGAWRNRRR